MGPELDPGLQDQGVQGRLVGGVAGWAYNKWHQWIERIKTVILVQNSWVLRQIGGGGCHLKKKKVKKKKKKKEAKNNKVKIIRKAIDFETRGWVEIGKVVSVDREVKAVILVQKSWDLGEN
jgi:hypothetical protein